MQPSIPWSSSVSLFVIEMMAIVHSLKCTVPFSFAVPLLSLAVTHCQLLSLFVTHFHSLSLVVPLVVTRCHSLPFIVTRCTTRCHSLSFVITRRTTRCHSMYYSSVFLQTITKRNVNLAKLIFRLCNIPLWQRLLECKVEILVLLNLHSYHPHK